MSYLSLVQVNDTTSIINLLFAFRIFIYTKTNIPRSSPEQVCDINVFTEADKKVPSAPLFQYYK